MLIKEVEVIDKAGLNLLEEEDSLNLIDELIELPLRYACKIFKEKNIETIMSSANKNNIASSEKPTEKEDIKGKYLFLDSPTFKDAGNGYGWIMLNFDTLSNKNKDLLFALERELGENYIWFVHPFVLGNLDYKIKTGQYTYEQLKTWFSEDEIPKDIEYDAYLDEFERRHIILGYNSRYPINSIFLRYPINEHTTVEEVEKYFSSLAQRFNNQLVKEDEYKQGYH